MVGNRTTYLDYLAKCEQAFQPFTPIKLPDFFKGRKGHVESLVRELNTPGRQVAIYGERGVGKTSLAELACFFARFDDQATQLVRCESASTYDDIFEQLLVEANVEFLPESRESDGGHSVQARLGPLSGARRRGTRTTDRFILSGRRMGPPLLLKHFRDSKGLLIIDEYDRVTDSATHTRLAETLKHFSDAASRTKIVIVGVAETLAGLIGEHQSLTRSLAQIELGRMPLDELAEIVTTGEERTSVVFHDGVRKKIIGLSDGFPYYTHLLCKYAAMEAGKVLQHDPAANVVVTQVEYEHALREAVRVGEASFSEAYKSAVITVKRKTDMFKDILWAVAYAEKTEVQVQDIADNVGLIKGDKPTVNSLSNCLGRLIKPDKNEVLTRVRQGYYRFSNPLMRAYVRLILEQHKIATNGQMEFPWMRSVET